MHHPAAYVYGRCLSHCRYRRDGLLAKKPSAKTAILHWYLHASERLNCKQMERLVSSTQHFHSYNSIVRRGDEGCEECDVNLSMFEEECTVHVGDCSFVVTHRPFSGEWHLYDESGLLLWTAMKPSLWCSKIHFHCKLGKKATLSTVALFRYDSVVIDNEGTTLATFKRDLFSMHTEVERVHSALLPRVLFAYIHAMYMLQLKRRDYSMALFIIGKFLSSSSANRLILKPFRCFRDCTPSLDRINVPTWNQK